jgi:uncharacterized CHY-type Zn-finger protein
MAPDRPPVLGLHVDPQGRCAHWHGPLDVVGLRLACCEAYYACRDCHDALTGHPAKVWPRESRDRRAALCGVCGAEMTVAAYLACEDRCPGCGAPFNPGCRSHRHLYFETP